MLTLYEWSSSNMVESLPKGMNQEEAKSSSGTQESSNNIFSRGNVKKFGQSVAEIDVTTGKSSHNILSGESPNSAR